MPQMEYLPLQFNTLDKIAAGLSEISLMAAGYLGRSSVVNNWRQTRPDVWRDLFSVSKEATIQVSEPELAAKPQDFQLASQWAREFLSLSLLVAVDLPTQLIIPFNHQAASLLTKDGIPTGRSTFLVKNLYLQQILAGEKDEVPEAPEPTETIEREALNFYLFKGGGA